VKSAVEERTTYKKVRKLLDARKKRRRKGRKESQSREKGERGHEERTHAPELARIAHGAVAHPPMTAVMSCPLVMSTHFGKSVTKSFALEIELAVMLAAIPASIQAIAAKAIAARLSHWFMMSNGLQSASALSRL
jgi:hypothetical protein